MIVDRSNKSPNFDDRSIPVEFVVIHYTALPLEESLRILCDPVRKVSSHLLISSKGEVHEMVPCLNGNCLRAWHAGKSRWFDGEKEWQTFNDFSIGVELENLNGNAFKYSEEQYLALIEVLAALKSLYPALSSAERVIGHEQIAGFRGKCDPGVLFDWARIFREVYPGQSFPPRRARLGVGLRMALKIVATLIPNRLRTLFGPLNGAIEAILKTPSM